MGFVSGSGVGPGGFGGELDHFDEVLRFGFFVLAWVIIVIGDDLEEGEDCSGGGGDEFELVHQIGLTENGEGRDGIV